MTNKAEYIFPKVLIAITLVFIITSCSIAKHPEFVKVSHVKVINATSTDFVVETLLIYRNPNDVGGTLQARDIKVYIDSIHVANASSESFHVPKKKEFNVPLITTIPFKKVYENNKGGLLGSVLDVLTNKKITIRYQGEVRYSLGKLHYDYPLDYTQELNLRKK